MKQKCIYIYETHLYIYTHKCICVCVCVYLTGSDSLENPNTGDHPGLSLGPRDGEMSPRRRKQQLAWKWGEGMSEREA